MPCLSRFLTSVSAGLLIMLMMTGCTTPQALPTLIVIPSQAPTTTSHPTITAAVAIVAQVATEAPTFTPVPMLTSTVTPSATVTETPTVTPTPMPSKTVTPTRLPPTATQTPGPIVLPPTAADAMVAGSDGLNLRSGPGTFYEPPVMLLEPKTPLKIIARSPDLLWYQVETLTGQQGWAFSRLLTVYQQPPNLPIIDVPLPTQPVLIVVQSAGAQSLPVNGGVGPLPVLGGGPNVVTDRVRLVYQMGQAMGNNPRVFIKVGDSLTENQNFMIGYGTGEYNLGPYTSLQTSVDYFSDKAHTRDSIAAEGGYSSASVLDSLQVEADSKAMCQPGEKPLDCEIRVMKPAFAIILFGGVDVVSHDVASYSNQIQQIIDVTTTRGVIPILTTFPHASNYYADKSFVFNDALRRIAAEQQIPLIDLQVAARPLPGGGVKKDGFHLTMRGEDSDRWIMLNGEEKQYSSTLRNMLTLQMLDSLRLALGLN